MVWRGPREGEKVVERKGPVKGTGGRKHRRTSLHRTKVLHRRFLSRTGV